MPSPVSRGAPETGVGDGLGEGEGDGLGEGDGDGLGAGDGDAEGDGVGADELPEQAARAASSRTPARAARDSFTE
jgi:hypothetical protein